MNKSYLRRAAAGAALAVTAAGSPILLAGVATASPESTQNILPGSLDTSDTRATGHVDFQFDGGLHVYTESNTSTDKAAGYFGINQPLADMGEPSMDWTAANPDDQTIPGKQMILDCDGHGDYATLVGEPVYGNDWWMTGGSNAACRDAAPETTGGSGSAFHGTLDEWRTALPDAEVLSGGFSLGSGLKGDGVISAMTYGGTTYTFNAPLGSCDVTKDDASKTLTLNSDCSTYSTLNVPDGWTVDGAGHSITAVQDEAHPTYAGAVLQSATGDDSGAATMNVKDLDITTQGFGEFSQSSGSNDNLFGIKMVRAGGTLTDVSVDGISHGSGAQEGRALYVNNEDNGSRDVPRASVSLDHVSITNYQKSGLYLRGNLNYDAQHLNVSSAAAADGTQNTVTAANGVTLIDGVRGSLTDSTLGENRYATDDGGSADDAQAGTSLLMYNAGRTTLTRNVISGTDGDTGILVYNDSNTINTVASITCSSITRTDGGHADANLGVGVSNDDNSSSAVTVSLGSNNFAGWKTSTSGDFTSVTDPSCTTTNTASVSTGRVTTGGSSKVTGSVANQDGSSAVGTVDLQARPNGTKTWKTVDSADTTDGSYAFTVKPAKRTLYRTHFTAPTEVGSYARAMTVAVAPKAGIRVSASPIKRNGILTVSGGVTPQLAGNNVSLQELRGTRWTTLKVRQLSSTGSYSITWKAPATTGRHTFRVLVAASSDFVAANSISKTVAVK